MKIRSELRAGRTFTECSRERDWWKKQAGLMEEYANSKGMVPPAGLWFPTAAVQLPSTPPIHPTTSSPKYYPDMSGVCQ